MTVGARKFSDLRCKHPTLHTQTAHFQHQRSAFLKITKNTKSHFLLSSFCSAVRCRAPHAVVYRRGGAPIDKPTGRCPTLQPPHPPSLSRRGKQHDFHAKVHSFSSEMHHSSSLPHTRATRHALSHRALSEFAIPAFTLHLHTYPSDTQTLARELHPHFLLHRGEDKGGEAFTLITLLSNDLRTIGEEVKAKNEKRRTRPRARKTPKRQLDCTSILGVRVRLSSLS